MNFITFAAGRQNYYDAVNRLTTQANNLNIFDKIIGYTDKDLKKDDSFWKQHSTFIENNKRGYGYWIWKPYIIKKTMESMNDGDCLLYLDCGCEIDISKKDKIIDSFQIVKNNYILGTTTHCDKAWTKMDLIIKLDILNEIELNSPQLQAGALLFFVCDKTRNIVNEWYELACDYHNIDDTPSNEKNFDCFCDHRHDQSIISLLAKKYKLYNRQYSLHDCINYSRNSSGESRL